MRFSEPSPTFTGNLRKLIRSTKLSIQFLILPENVTTTITRTRRALLVVVVVVVVVVVLECKTEKIHV
jgi:hypothetical protein